MKLLVAGSSGFVGRRLCLALSAAGHTVQAMTRRPDTYSGVGQAVYGDVRAPDSLLTALAGCEVAYYLVHSLGEADFASRDDAAARAFATPSPMSCATSLVYSMPPTRPVGPSRSVAPRS